MFLQSEERFFKGYELILRALGVDFGERPSDKKSKKKKTKYTDKQFKPADEYAKLTPAQREDLTKNMMQEHMAQVTKLWSSGVS